jgi:hypothetical protein
MEPADLERLVDERLKQLPAPHAPDTLLPRVLAAIEQHGQAPWHSRAWRTWPIAWQLVSAVACLAILTAVVSALPRQLVIDVARFVSSPSTGETVAVADQAESATRAAWVLWRVVLQPLVPYALALSMLMCVACVGFGMALNYVVFGRTLQR